MGSFDVVHVAGGLFTFVCKHRVLYAFHVIPQSEERIDGFSFFRKHFVKPPRIIVYDFWYVSRHVFLLKVTMRYWLRPEICCTD